MNVCFRTGRLAPRLVVWAACVVAAIDTTAQSTPAGARTLPGADGPRVEFVGAPPHEFDIVDAFVYAQPEQAASGIPRPNRFPTGVTRLTLDVRVKDLPRLGTTFRYEVLTSEGVLEMSEGLFSFARLKGEAVASLDFDLRPRAGPFKNGAYQLRLFMNDVLVAVLNWSVGE